METSESAVFTKCFNSDLTRKTFVYSVENSKIEKVVWVQGVIVNISSSPSYNSMNSSETVEMIYYNVSIDDGTDILIVRFSPDIIGVQMPQLRCYVSGNYHSYKIMEIGDYIAVQGYLALSSNDESQIRDNSNICIQYVVANTFSILIDPNMETLWQLEVMLSRSN